MKKSMIIFKSSRFPDRIFLVDMDFEITKDSAGNSRFHFNTDGVLRYFFKSCSLCNINWSIYDFYSKGQREDNICKTCHKEKKRAKYVVEKKVTFVARLTELINLSTNGIIKMIHSETERLDEVIACLKKSKQ